jgi:hypothetical protein
LYPAEDQLLFPGVHHADMASNQLEILTVTITQEKTMVLADLDGLLKETTTDHEEVLRLTEEGFNKIKQNLQDQHGPRMVNMMSEEFTNEALGERCWSLLSWYVPGMQHNKVTVVLLV